MKCYSRLAGDVGLHVFCGFCVVTLIVFHSAPTSDCPLLYAEIKLFITYCFMTKCYVNEKG